MLIICRSHVRHMSTTWDWQKITWDRQKTTWDWHTIDKKHEILRRHNVDTDFCVDIMSTSIFVVFVVFFVDGMLIWCPFWSSTCRFLSISCRWHVSNMRSTNYPYFINWCQFLVVFFWTTSEWHKFWCRLHVDFTLKT